MRINLHALALAIALAGCASTAIEASYKAPHASELTSVVTISPSPDRDLRHTLEDQMAAQLSHHGVHAVPAYRVFSAEDLSDRDRLVASARAKGYDGLVAMRLVDARAKVTYTAGFDTFWREQWGEMAPATVVRIQINAYSLDTQKLVWTAVTKSMEINATHDPLADVTRVAGDQLAGDRVVGASQAASR